MSSIKPRKTPSNRIKVTQVLLERKRIDLVRKYLGIKEGAAIAKVSAELEKLLCHYATEYANFGNVSLLSDMRADMKRVQNAVKRFEQSLRRTQTQVLRYLDYKADDSVRVLFQRMEAIRDVLQQTLAQPSARGTELRAERAKARVWMKDHLEAWFDQHVVEGTQPVDDARSKFSKTAIQAMQDAAEFAKTGKNRPDST